MASYFSSSRKVLYICFALLFFISLLTNAYSEAFLMSTAQSGTRRLLGLVDEDFDKPIKKSSSSSSSSTSSTSLSSKKNQTKLLKPVGGLSNNQTKLIKSTTDAAANNRTKLIKTTSDSTKNKTKLVKPISDNIPDSSVSFKTLNITSKSSNSTKSSSLQTKKSSDLQISPKNKINKPLTTQETKIQLGNTQKDSTKSKSQDKKQSLLAEKPRSQKVEKKTQASWFDQGYDDDDGLVAEFRDLPSKFQESLLPDLETISRTSQVYLTRYNKEITKNVKPIVGKKYASNIASFVSFAFLIIPIILVSLIFNRIKAYFSLQKLLIFIQIYLAIYFFILSLSSIITGLEPLKFFYATSQSTYVGLQVMQTLAYVLYLLLLLMYMVLVFSTETGPVSKLLALGQTLVGFAVGLHYYMKVFHRAVLRQAPMTSWKVHALYATCFLLICLLTNADRRKKAYLEEGGEEGKKN